MLDETLQKKSVDIPQWLIDSVIDYQKKSGIQSFAKALNILACIGLHHETVEDPERIGWLGGSEEAEKALSAEYNQVTETNSDIDYPEFFRRKLNGGWGGSRK